MDYLVSFFQLFWDSFKNLLEWLLSGISYSITGVLYFVFDGFLTVITAIVGSLDFGTIVTSYAGYWSGLPPQLIYVVNACGIGPGVSMMVYAIGIRMLLNLIPAALTRV